MIHRPYRRYLVLLGAWLLGVSIASGEAVTVTATLTPERIPFHHSARYRVEVKAPRDATVEIAPWATAMPGLTIQREAPVIRLDRERNQIVTQDFTLVPIVAARYELPALEIIINAALHTTLPPRGLDVRELTPDELEAVAQIRPVLSLAEAEARGRSVLGYYLLSVSVVLALLGGIVWGWRRWTTRRHPMTPWEAAEGALRHLAHLLESRQIRGEMFYDRFDAILRDYIAQRYGVGTREASTPELMDSLDELDVLGLDHVEILRGLLRAVDRVRFAQRQPNRAQMTRELEEAIDFVVATRPASLPDHSSEMMEQGAA